MQAVELVRRPQPMYNLTVERAHTYFVGSGRWLVHNACPLPSQIQIPGPHNSPYGKLDYLLGRVPGNLDSQGKGGFFGDLLGFSDDTLEAALNQHLIDNFDNGVKYTRKVDTLSVTGPITGPSGKTAQIKSVWEALSDGTYRLITAHPDKKMSTNLPYAIRVVAGKILVELKEFSTEDLERTVGVVVNGEIVGKITFIIHIHPQLMITDSYVTVWGGQRIFVFSIIDKEGYQLNWNDEVHYIFSIDSLWCIVGEISIVLYDVSLQQEVDRYDHSEIILEAVLAGNQLTVADLEKNHLEFQIVNRALLPASN